jgi:AcrR family transcriptional regulator
MPRIVDHDERRLKVVASAWRVIERVGVENATLRDIADDLGCSIGSLVHYFRNKDDLIGFAFQQVSQHAFAGIEEAAAKAKPGLERLRISLERLLPSGSGRQAGTLVSLSFWGHAATNPRLATIHRTAYAQWRGIVRKYLKEAIAEGQIADDIDLDATGAALISLVDGLLVAQTLEPQRFPKTMPKKVLNAMLDKLLA